MRTASVRLVDACAILSRALVAAADPPPLTLSLAGAAVPYGLPRMT
jgi:hypothetical protein